MSDFERLNDINQNIWNDGFTEANLRKLETIAEDIRNGAAVFERIPYAQQSGLSKGSGILCAAAVICRGCPCTESETRQIYDTEDLSGEGLIQEVLVENWAKLVGKWLYEPEESLERYAALVDFGTESVVYFYPWEFAVYKMISLKHYNILRLALDRIIIHNALFPETAMKVIGFSRNKSRDFVVIIKQPYVRGDVITESDRKEFMENLGFRPAGMDYGMHLNYCTDTLYIGDLNEFNVIKDVSISPAIAVIDADCRLNVSTLDCGGRYIIPQPLIDFSEPNVEWKKYIS